MICFILAKQINFVAHFVNRTKQDEVKHTLSLIVMNVK